MLVDGPCELVVQLPGNEAKSNSRDSHEHGYGDQHRLNGDPEVVGDERFLVEGVGGVFDLIELDSCIHHDAYVVDDESNDLNGVLEAQCIPYEEQLVEVAEHEDGKICGDGAGLAIDIVGFEVQLALEAAEDVAAEVLVL